MIQEYISKTWLLQNTNTGQTVIEMMQTIKAAPVVEFDVDEPPNKGRCEKCEHRIGVSCRYWMGFTDPYDWCSKFKRRENTI